MNFVWAEAQKWVLTPWVVKPLVGPNEIFGKDVCARRDAAAQQFADVAAHIPDLVDAFMAGLEQYHAPLPPLFRVTAPETPPRAPITAPIIRALAKARPLGTAFAPPGLDCFRSAKQAGLSPRSFFPQPPPTPILAHRTSIATVLPASSKAPPGSLVEERDTVAATLDEHNDWTQEERDAVTAALDAAQTAAAKRRHEMDNYKWDNTVKKKYRRDELDNATWATIEFDLEVWKDTLVEFGVDDGAMKSLFLLAQLTTVEDPRVGAVAANAVINKLLKKQADGDWLDKPSAFVHSACRNARHAIQPLDDSKRWQSNSWTGGGWKKG